jgi:hypothetical protein
MIRIPMRWDAKVRGGNMKKKAGVMRLGEAGTGREQTALVKMFDPGTMMKRGRAAAFSVLGQCHESNLRRRPPCHWLRPPR